MHPSTAGSSYDTGTAARKDIGTTARKDIGKANLTVKLPPTHPPTPAGPVRFQVRALAPYPAAGLALTEY